MTAAQFLSFRSLVTAVLSCAAMIALGWAGIAYCQVTDSPRRDQPGSGQRATFMRLKLEPTKELLEGIAVEDFERVSRAAERLRLLSLDESWMVIQTDEYRRHSDEFRRSVGLVSRAAKEGDVDAATLAYMQVTLNCVRCHRQLRSGD